MNTFLVYPIYTRADPPYQWDVREIVDVQAGKVIGQARGDAAAWLHVARHTGPERRRIIYYDLDWRAVMAEQVVGRLVERTDHDMEGLNYGHFRPSLSWVEIQMPAGYDGPISMNQAVPSLPWRLIDLSFEAPVYIWRELRRRQR